MHIVQVTTELRPAGAEVIVLNLTRGLIAAGHRVTTIALQTLPPASFIVDGLRQAGATVETLGADKRHPWRLLGLRRCLKRLAPDLVHAHLLHANLASRLAGLPRRPWTLVNSVHIAERRASKRWHFWLDRWTQPWCDCQTAVSEAVRDFHAARLGIDPATMPVVYNGIALQAPLTPASARARREEWGVADCARVIGSVGRLNPQKGYDLLLGMLDAIGAAIPAGERWGLVIVGEGPERPRLEALTARAPANLVVRLPGFREDAPVCAGAFDLFVMPSRYEGFGLTLAEAMAQGVPVLAADVDSLPELVRHYPAGETIGFNPGNGAEVATAIRRLIGKGRGEPLRRFAEARMVDEYLALYERLRKSAAKEAS